MIVVLTILSQSEFMSQVSLYFMHRPVAIYFLVVYFSQEKIHWPNQDKTVLYLENGCFIVKNGLTGRNPSAKLGKNCILFGINLN